MPEIELTEWQIENLARPLVQQVFGEIQEYFKNVQNEQRFQKWYEATYGESAPQGV